MLEELHLGGCRAPAGPQGTEMLQRFLSSCENLQVLELGNLGQVGKPWACRACRACRAWRAWFGGLGGRKVESTVGHHVAFSIAFFLHESISNDKETKQFQML